MKHEIHRLRTVFDGDRYFDIVVEYAKASAEDILIKVTVHNRGSEPAVLHLLPTLWFRNVWSWSAGVPKPTVSAAPDDACAIVASHWNLGDYYLCCEGDPEPRWA